MTTTENTQADAAAAAEQDAEGHRYEDHGKIYFYFDEGRWHLDSTSVDGYPLDGLEGLDCTFGGCPNHCETCKTQAATAEREQAETTPLPTGRDVLDMLADWFGYTLIKAEDQLAAAAEPDALLAEFRSYLRKAEQRAAEYYADPDNEKDAAATGLYVDDRAELYAQAAGVAERLDTLARAGHLPQAWAIQRGTNTA
ncbi:hypothetical protein [Nocardia terpenica]|uniref:Uncharacterized protein n=1 Tax=Nocardia terpenica TaxID=455432 RepID=A0A291RYW2_9NOCA|nr:hypothetical protein [Nocardia terpenica]ATL72507.1 hypothetical protein CRH09_39735 [Nocardia terpenica]